MERRCHLLRIVSAYTICTILDILYKDVTLLDCHRLSGLSPFMGDTVPETFVNITRVDWDFEDEAFDHVSQDAKDFISKLLLQRKEDRMTADECLNFRWLAVDNEDANNNRICTDKLKKFIIRRKWQVCRVSILIFVAYR